MIIQNGIVFQEDHQFVKKDVYTKNDRIVTSVDQADPDIVIDAEGLYVLPGLIDVHSHGATGCDFSDGDAEGLRKILSYEHAHGVTSYCPTSMSLERDTLRELFSAQAKNLRNLQPQSSDPAQQPSDQAQQLSDPARESSSAPLSRVVGFHMEGPFLDRSKKGAHRTDCLAAPDINFFRSCNAACNHLIKLVTIAPNSEGALEFIRALREETTISLGHTDADYDTAKKALCAGANHVTHLFNAMSPLCHRDPGLIGAASEDPCCYAELICDGIHVHESAVRAAFRLFPDRIVLISDSMRATGLGDGVYDLGGQQVTVSGNLATLADGTIAGSVTNLYDCMRNAVRFGIPLEKAVAAASENPAKSIGIYEETGSLTPGKRADILLTDQNLNLIRVI